MIVSIIMSFFDLPQNHPPPSSKVIITNKLLNYSKKLNLIPLLLLLYPNLKSSDSLSIQETNKTLIPNYCYYSCHQNSQVLLPISSLPFPPPKLFYIFKYLFQGLNYRKQVLVSANYI